MESGIHAAALIGYSGDIRRFANRGTLCLLQRHGADRVLLWSADGASNSTQGSRRLNNALRMAAVTQIRNPGTEGRIYFERKVSKGKTKKEALRSLKRQVSNAVYRSFSTLDKRSGRTPRRTTQCLRGCRLYTPAATGSSAKSLRTHRDLRRRVSP